MKAVVPAVAAALFLSSCSDSSNQNQSDPVNNTPPQQSGQTGNTAPADRDPTPQTGTGGQSPATSPSGTVNQ
jgi:PBP1b-binding outer membrane lipoprotein LpoB